MDYRNRRAIHSRAAEVLSQAGQTEKQLILVFCGITTLMSLLSLAVSYILDLQIAETGGLSNIGLRTVLSTVQSFLPIAQIVVSVCMGFSYQQNILRIARGGCGDYRTLGQGFLHCGVLLRLSLLEGLIYFAIGFVSVQLSSIIFAMTPYAAAYFAVMEPVLDSVSSLGTIPVLDEATADAILDACLPAVWIFLGLFLLLSVPVFFRYRLSRLVLADDPRTGAFAALRKSRTLLRRRCMELLKLDFSLWWFYLMQVLIAMVLYADLLLPLMGISLPWNEDTVLFMVNIASLTLQFAVYYIALNRVNVAYALFYDALLTRHDEAAPAIRQDPPKNLPFQTDF